MVNVVTNISPKETPLLSGLRKGREATQTLHEYLTATFASAADNAAAEASAFSAADLTQPTRSSNNTQIFTDHILLSGTEMSVGGTAQGAWAYQAEKNLTEHAKDIELALMAGSRASGSSGVARRMVGIIAALTTNATTRNSGSSLGETTFNDIMNMIYNSTSEVASEVYVGGTLKRDISGFTAGITQNISADDKRLINAVDVYVSDFGMHKIFLHRNVPNGANAKMLVAINPKYHEINFLAGRRTKVDKLAKDGDRERAMIVSELTVSHLGEASGAAVGGFTS